MRVFLTGVSGILGTDINKLFTVADHEVKGFTSTDIELDNLTDVKAKVRSFRPDLIIHCAAMTNVDLCEDEKQKAYAVNVTGTQNLAVVSGEIGIKMVYISSCGVYGNGKSTPYNELDDTNPSTYHHYTKLLGEIKVKEHNNQFLIIRPGWLFGGSPTHKKNFVEARRKEASQTNLLKSAIDKTGSPTYTLDLAHQLMHLINEDMTGTFNIVNEDCASRFDYVKQIMKEFKLNTKVEPVNSNLFPRNANMPDNECLENMNLNLVNLNKMRSWQMALSDYINTNY